MGKGNWQATVHMVAQSLTWLKRSQTASKASIYSRSIQRFCLVVKALPVCKCSFCTNTSVCFGIRLFDWNGPAFDPLRNSSCFSETGLGFLVFGLVLWRQALAWLWDRALSLRPAGIGLQAIWIEPFVVVVSHLNCWTIAFFFFFFNKFGVQILDSGPGFPTDSLYGQLLFTLEEKPLGNGITIILSILRVPPYTDLNLSPSSCTFLRKWTNLTKGNLEYLWPLWRTFEVLKFN